MALKHGRYVKEGEKESEYRIMIQRATWKDFKHYFGKWENGKILLGTSVSWFAHDVAYYGVGLNNAMILESIGFSETQNPYQSLSIFIQYLSRKYYYNPYGYDTWILGYSIRY